MICSTHSRRNLFLTALLVLSVSATGGAFAGPAAAANESVTVTKQTTLGDTFTVDTVNTGTIGTHVAIGTTSETGAPKNDIASKNVGSGYQNRFEDFSGLGLTESRDFIVAVHSGTPSTTNIEALSAAKITHVTADVDDPTAGDAPTYWQGQVVVLRGDSASSETFTAGQEYQVRSLSKNADQQWEVDPGPVETIRATGNNALIVRTEDLRADAYAVESDQSPLATGDTPGSAGSLDRIPNYAFEVDLQTMEITPENSEVPEDRSLNVTIESNRAGYDAVVRWNGTQVGGTLTDLGTVENVPIPFPDGDIPDEWLGNTEDLTITTVDTTASDTERVAVFDVTVPPPFPETAQISNVEHDQTGDFVTISLYFTAQSTASNKLRTWMLVGGPDERVLDLVNVIDVNDDGKVTVVVNTWRIGRGDPPAGVSNAGYTAVGADRVSVTRPRHYTDVPGAHGVAGPGGSERVWGHATGATDPEEFDAPPRDGIARPLGPATIQLTTMSKPVINLSQDETELEFPAFSDADAFTLQERTTEEDIEVHVAPSGTPDSSLDTVADIEANATLVSGGGQVSGDVVANGDVVILEIQASGLDGYVDSADGIGDLLAYTNPSTGNLEQTGSNGIHTWVAQQGTPASGDRYYWDLASDASLVANGSNDTYYVRVPTDSLTGVGTRDSEVPPKTTYTAEFAIAGGPSADFWVQDHPDDPNFQATGDDEPAEEFDLSWSPYLPDRDDGHEFASGGFRLAQRMAGFDQYVQNVGELRVDPDSNVTLSGETTLAPGSSFDIWLRNTTTDLAVDRSVTVSVDSHGDRGWSADGIDLSDQDRGTPFLTWALERGTSISNPAQASVNTSRGDALSSMINVVPTASVTFDDQQARDSGTVVTVQDVRLNRSGFVAIHRGSASGEIIGVSDYLEAGIHSDVQVRFETALPVSTTLVAMPHRDTNQNREFDFGADPGEDTPFSVDGDPVVDGAMVSISTPTTTQTPTPTTTTPSPTTTIPPSTTQTPPSTTSTQTASTPPSSTPTRTPTTTPTPTAGDGPGFGVIVALLALVAAALLTLRRRE